MPSHDPPVRADPDERATLDRAAALAAATAEPASVAEVDRLLAALDLTTLEGTDCDDRVRALCDRALATPVAAVCVYPAFVRLAAAALAGSPVRVASVAGAFPTGHAPLDLRVAEVRRALEDGACEVDVVLRRGPFLAGERELVRDELAALREAAGGATLKVILETGELGSTARVRDACRLAIDAGADFVKTSTGKGAVGATPPLFLAMCDVVREHAERTGRRVGLKAAGGIRTAREAAVYAALAAGALGDAWRSPERFRLGASSLADDLLRVRERLAR